MNLDQFMNQTRVRNVYVSEPGWLSLYVRRGIPRTVNGKKREFIIELANIVATKKGQGTFLKLIQRIRSKNTPWVIYIECVLNPRFGFHLDDLGFTRIVSEGAPSFYLCPEDNWI